MNDIDFSKDCQLTSHLKELSSFDGGSKSRLAGALLLRLGYPDYIQLPNITFIAEFMQEIAKLKQINLLPEAKEKCMYCPHSGRCVVGFYLKVTDL